MHPLTIGKLAKQAGVGIDTVRFYEREALLKKPARTAAGYRLYSEADIARLQFIRRAKALGFSLDEIANLLQLNDGRGKRSSVRSVAQRRLSEIESKLMELTAIRHTLRTLVRRCHGEGDVTGCPIIEAVLSTGPESSRSLSKRRAP